MLEKEFNINDEQINPLRKKFRTNKIFTIRNDKLDTINIADQNENGNERFECPHPSCNKSFSRYEHLARHKLNHWPKKIFECSYIFEDTNTKCTRSFVRKDLLTRHVKRHYSDKNRVNSKNRREKSINTNNNKNKVKKRKTTDESKTPNDSNQDNNQECEKEKQISIDYDYYDDKDYEDDEDGNTDFALVPRVTDPVQDSIDDKVKKEIARKKAIRIRKKLSENVKMSVMDSNKRLSVVKKVDISKKQIYSPNDYAMEKELSNFKSNNNPTIKENANENEQIFIDFSHVDFANNGLQKINKGMPLEFKNNSSNKTSNDNIPSTKIPTTTLTYNQYLNLLFQNTDENTNHSSGSSSSNSVANFGKANIYQSRQISNQQRQQLLPPAFNKQKVLQSEILPTSSFSYHIQNQYQNPIQHQHQHQHHNQHHNQHQNQNQTQNQHQFQHSRQGPTRIFHTSMQERPNKMLRTMNGANSQFSLQEVCTNVNTNSNLITNNQYSMSMAAAIPGANNIQPTSNNNIINFPIDNNNNQLPKQAFVQPSTNMQKFVPLSNNRVLSVTESGTFQKMNTMSTNNERFMNNNKDFLNVGESGNDSPIVTANGDSSDKLKNLRTTNDKNQNYTKEVVENDLNPKELYNNVIDEETPKTISNTTIVSGTLSDNTLKNENCSKSFTILNVLNHDIADEKIMDFKKPTFQENGTNVNVEISNQMKPGNKTATNEAPKTHIVSSLDKNVTDITDFTLDNEVSHSNVASIMPSPIVNAIENKETVNKPTSVTLNDVVNSNNTPLPPHFFLKQSDNMSTAFTDLFSLDFLTTDPLQNLMLEISHHENDLAMGKLQETLKSDYIKTTKNSSKSKSVKSAINDKMAEAGTKINHLPEAESITKPTLQALNGTTAFHNNKNNKGDKITSNPMSTASSDRPPIPQSQIKFEDKGRSVVKDNLLAQKTNIDVLKRKHYMQDNRNFAGKLNKEKKFNNIHKLMESFKSVPKNFHSDPETKYKLTFPKNEELFKLIPELRYIPAEILQKSLKTFWEKFHPQYGLIHKPSFNVDDQPPILLLTMLMTGASYLGPSYRETISDPICGPLRWIIFSHKDFQPPSRTYIIQSLLLLEKYEKASTNRYLHERSYLHHGTTIQLLRRTPSLGGHPLRDKTKHDGSELSDDINDILKEWIEFESLKRVAYFAFYMDISHAVVYGYMTIFINFRQIKLDIPCPDRIWETYNLTIESLKQYGFGSKVRKQNGNITFLGCIRSFIKIVMGKIKNIHEPNKSEVDEEEIEKLDINSVMGKKALLAGILSLMFQCQEENGDPLVSFVMSQTYKEPDMTWREVISFAINYWFFEIQGSCKTVSKCMVNDINDSISDRCKKDIWRENEYNCKLPIYHMSQIFLRIFHNDYYVAAGAPWRMNVRIGDKEFKTAQKRMMQFAKSTFSGGITLIYAFQFLFEMFVRKDPDTNAIYVDTSYDINTDHILTRPNVIALTTLIIWTYSFTLYGGEAYLWENGDNDDLSIKMRNMQMKADYVPKEDLETYLKRMYNELYVSTSQDVLGYQNAIWEKAVRLTHVENQQNTVGLVKFVRGILNSCYWDLGKELSNLLDNCLERSLGKENHVCYDMYNV